MFYGFDSAKQEI